MSLASDYKNEFYDEPVTNLRSSTMNFQSVEAVVGQQDEKGYQVKIAMNATVGQVYPSEFNKNGKKIQSVMLTDGAGVQNKVKIFIGQSPDIATGSAGVFLVGPNPYENKMYFSGFVQGTLQAGQAPQQPQQQAPPQQQPAPYTPPSQAPPQNSVQDDIRFAQALNRASDEFIGCKIEEVAIKERTRIYYHILKSRTFPASMGGGAPPAQQPQQQAPPPQQQFDVNPGLDEEIPF